MPLGSAFFLGLLGGLHCAGMCGPLMLALPIGGRTTVRFVAGRVVYHLGRISTYCGLGLMVGWIGRTLLVAGVQQGVSIGLGLVLLGGLAFSPRFLELPWIVLWVGRLKLLMGAFLRKRTFSSQLVLGALNGLLPCGLVYAACAGAAAAGAAAGGAVAGVAFMLAFGLGTLPIMLAISLSGRLLPQAIRLRLRFLTPVSIALIGCLLVLRGLSLGIPFLSPDLAMGAGCCGGTAMP